LIPYARKRRDQSQERGYASIKKSVGTYGKNDSAHIVEVQKLLNKFITAKVLEIDILVVDGVCGPKT